MTKRTDKNCDNSASSADDDSSNKITPDELEKWAQWREANPLPKDGTSDELDRWMEANPGLTKKQPPDDEAVTTVRFLGKKQTEAYKRQIKAAEGRKKRNK